MRIQNLSLKAKIVGAMAMLVALVVIFVFFYFPARQNAQAEQAKQNEINGIAKVSAKAIVAGLEFEDLETVENILAGVKAREDLIRLEVLKPSGETFFIYDAATQNAMSDAAVRHCLSVEAPVLSGEDSIGNLKLVVSLQALERQKALNRLKCAFSRGGHHCAGRVFSGFICPIWCFRPSPVSAGFSRKLPRATAT